MATNIEQIFRSFVVSKFREIQEQQFGSGKLSQQNGEINSSEDINSADITIGALQNDPIVQKIEQVLSEVLGAESQYKPDAGQDTVKNKSRSTKRGIPDEVQDEIPRKKSKKDKKHKDKKKKKKRKKEKKEKKYKKQSKESKLNSDHKGCGDIQPASNLNPENIVLSAEIVDVGPTSPLKHDSQWFMEKTVYENLNSSLSNSHDASNSDTSKLDASEEDSVLISIQEVCEVELTNEREMENCTYQHTSLAVNLHAEDDSLNTAEVEGDDTTMKEMEQPEASPAIQVAEYTDVSEKSPKFMAAELEDLETKVDSYSVEVKELDCLSESLAPETTAQPESDSFEKTGGKFMKTPLETNAEAKDSVTTLGFLAMVVGKDFEATSEFLNKAKVKASETSPKDDALTDMKDELEQDSEKVSTMEDLGKTLQTPSRIQKKDLEGIPESLYTVTEKDLESSLAPKPKTWPKVSAETDECECREESLDPRTIGARERKETQTSAIVMELNEPLEYQKSLEIVADVKDLKGTSELEVIKRTDPSVYFLDTEVEAKHLEAAAERGISVYETEKEERGTIPERVVSMKNLESVKTSQVNYQEASLETVGEKKGDMDVPEDSEAVVEMKVSETFSEINNLEMAPESLDNSSKTQYLDVSKPLAMADVESETEVNTMDLKKNPEQPSMTLKKIETISETLYMTEMKHVKDILHSDVLAKGKDTEINLKPEGQEDERDLDAASDSLHMIFTNYSEQSLELYTEPEAMMELKNAERIPELLHMEDTNNSEVLLAREVEDLKTIESPAVVKLNELERKIEHPHREGENREMDFKAVTNVKYLETLVPSEAVTQRKDIKIVPYSVTGVKEKALDTTEYVKNSQNGAEAAAQEIKSGFLKVKDVTEKQRSAEIKGPLLISESFKEVNIVSSERTPEVDIIPVIQEIRETEEFTPVLDVDSPNKTSRLEMSALIDPKDASKDLSTADFDSISNKHAVQNLESLPFVKTKDREIVLGSQHALEVKYIAPSPELLFSDELTNLQEKQKLEESTEATRFTATPHSPYASGTDLIVASESDEVNKVIDSEHCSKSLYMAQTNSDNFLKSLYKIHPKDSEIISESKIMDSKDLEIKPETSHKGGRESEDLLEYESVAASQFLEIIEEFPKKNEMQESNTAFGDKVLMVPGLEVNSETFCGTDTENLEVVKKTHVAATSQFTLGVISIEETPIPVSAAEDKDLKATEIMETAVELKHLVASTAPADIVKETIDFALVMDTKNLEANQMLEANLESVDKKGVNTIFDHAKAPNGSEIKKHKPTVDAVEKESGTDLKPESALVEKYSESVCESVEVSETGDCDATLSMYIVDVKDSELNSDFVDAGEVKTLKTTLQFETTQEPLCMLHLGNSDNVESLLTTEMKDLGEPLNCEVVLEAKVPPATNLSTSELKSSESLCVLEITNSEEILELTTPTYPSSAHLKPSGTTEKMEALNIINSETPLKSETEVIYFESVSETDTVLEPFVYKAVPESEYISEEKISETASEVICLKQVGDLEMKPSSNYALERKELEPLTQSMCTVQAKYMEESLVYEEVQNVPENTTQFLGTMAIEDLGATTSSVVAEMEKNSDKKLQLHFQEECSETAKECTRMPDLMETYANVEPVCRTERRYSEPIAEMACVVDIKNSETNSEFRSMTELKNTAFVKSKTGPELTHLKDLEAIPECESLGKLKDVQIVQSSMDKEGMCFEGSSESLLVLERQHLERNSTSVLVSEAVPEESLISIPAVKDSEAACKYKNAKDIEVSEQSSECVCVGEMKDLSSLPEHAELAQAENSETSSEISLEVKNLEATLVPLCLIKEKTSEETSLVCLEDQIVKASLKPVCGAEDSNLVASQQVTVEVKDSEAAPEPVSITEKALEATSCTSLKDQQSEAVPESSEIMKENDESISKDKKSEKISSKSKEKSKSGKKAKKSRSKSPSKSKKRKKKSRSRSTSRQMSSRRARSRSKDDSDARKKHSSSRRKSRSKSAERKEGKESSLRSRRRRSRTSDHHKSRSKSVDKRESSLRSRRRRSRSSDRRKSRSKSVDRRESVRTRRRLSRSSDNHKSRSKSVDKRETSIRSRRRRSRSSDHHKSRSRSADKRDTSTRTRRRRSRSSDNHKSRSQSVDKRESPVRRRRRRSRSSDNYKSRSKSVDRRESSVRSRRRWSRSSDHHKSRSRSVDDKREISVRTRRKRSRSSENRRSRSKSVDKRESVRTRRRRSRSSDKRKSRSRSGNKETLRTRRRRSRSPDNRKSRSKSVEKQESSVRTRRRRSRSSDHKSRSKSVDKRETAVKAKRRRSVSSDNCKSRSKSVDIKETSAKAKSRRSRSSDNRKSRSKSVDKRETSTKTKRRSRSSDNRKSRSKSVDKRETSVRARRRSRSSDNRKSRSKSLEKRESSARSKRKRSRSSENCKSRSKSVDKIEVSSRSKRRRSKSSDHKSVTKSDEKRESSLKSRRRRSKSKDRQKSKSKSRSKSSERRKDKDSSNVSKGKCSKSRSKSNSPEKTVETESLEASVHNHAKSPEHPKSKSRSRSRSLDKTEDRDRLRRSRSKGSESKSRSHRTLSRSRRNCSRSLTRKRTSRSKSDHRSRSRSRTRSRSCSKRWRRTRSRSVSRQRSLSRERRRRSRRNRSRSVDRRRRRSDSRDSYRITLRLRSRSRTPVRLGTSRSTGRRRSSSISPDHRRSRSSSRSPKRLTDLDKAQLLEIAKANAAAMCAKAGVPLPPSLMPVVTPEKKEEKVTQKSAKETIMELTEKCKKIAQSQEDDVIVNKPHVSDEEEEEHPFINHPFKLNEPKPIFFNLTTPTIKPAPPKNQVTLTKEFPVSSGSQHRKKEADSAYGEWVPVEKNKEENKDDVFPNPANLEPVDISSALNERTIAQKRLTENTFDLEAMCLLNRAQERIDAWAQLNSLPGQFTGSTGAQVLSSEQLSNSGPQAWIKKDQFLRAAPVTGGMGAQLMRKMGWREGEGLGKNKEGSKEPILVDFKTDRKGLVAIGEKTQKRHGIFSAVKDLAGKHPISLLMEACNKRRWSPPTFVLVTDNGPDHRKCFLFKVMVNGVEHKPTFASPNKKLAKATAATVALQALGIVPKELLANATSFRSASHN